jgi:hypothetical protein
MTHHRGTNIFKKKKLSNLQCQVPGLTDIRLYEISRFDCGVDEVFTLVSRYAVLQPTTATTSKLDNARVTQSLRSTSYTFSQRYLNSCLRLHTSFLLY